MSTTFLNPHVNPRDHYMKTIKMLAENRGIIEKVNMTYIPGPKYTLKEPGYVPPKDEAKTIISKIAKHDCEEKIEELNQRIATLKAKKKKLEAEIVRDNPELAAELQKKNTEIEHLKQVLQAKANLETQLATSQQRKTELDARLAANTKEIATLMQAKATAEAQLATSQQKVNELTAALEKNNSTLANVKNDLASLQQQRHDVNALNKEKDNLIKTNKQLTDERDDLIRQRANLFSRNENQTSQIKGQENRIRQLQVDNQTITDARDKLKTVNDVFVERVRAHIETITALETRIESLEEKLTSANSKNAELTQTLAQLTAEKSRLENELSELKSSNVELTFASQMHEASANKLREDITACKEDKDRSDGERLKLINDMSILKTSRDEMISGLNSRYEKDTIDLRSQNEKLQKHMKICDKDIDNCTKEKEDLKKQLKTINDQFLSLKSKKELNEFELTGLRSRIEDLSAQLRDVTNVTKLCEIDKNELTKKIEKLQEFYKNVQGESNKCKNELMLAKGEIDSLQSNNEIQAAKILELNRNLKEIRSDAKAMANQMSTIDAALKRNKEQGMNTISMNVIGPMKFPNLNQEESEAKLSNYINLKGGRRIRRRRVHRK